MSKTTKSNGMATSGMIMGILSTVFNVIPFLGFISIILAVLGIIFGGIGMAKSGVNGGKGKAIAGVVLGLINIVWFFVSLVLMAAAVATVL
jgi:hypothetical protein